MAELADAYGSGPYVRKDMQVQVLLSAPAQCLCPLPRGHSFYSFTFYRRLDLLSLTALSSILYSLHSTDRALPFMGALVLFAHFVQNCRSAFAHSSLIYPEQTHISKLPPIAAA